MHGYHIMRELNERTQGVWNPSPGSVYPLLHQMTDEGLLTSQDTDGRRVFSLTEAGQTQAAAVAGGVPVWERIAGSLGSIDLRDAIDSLASAARQVTISGTIDQIEAAERILADARKKLYQLLAE